jgi:dimethylaniline monooxygenase (N-oxide forming)
VTLNIGIIGSGIAGLSSAKILRQLGYAVTLFEREPDLGGVWASSRRYPGLTTQNPRTTYAFSDFPMPKHWPEWPSGEQVQQYLTDYARHFGILDRIHLATEVVNASPGAGGRGWELRTRSVHDGSTDEHRFDFLVVCNGIFCTPFVPDYPGAEAFRAAGGRVCHTSQFTRAEDARGKHVVVVGYGKSSCDVAQSLLSAAAGMNVVVRHLTWKIPKLIGGVLNFKYLFFTRMGEGLFRYIRVRGFEKFLHGPGLPLRNAMMGTVAAVIARQYRLRSIGLHPEKHLETIARSTVSLATEGFYDAIADGRIGFHKGAEIVELRPGEAVLSNGRTVPADIVIAGTGWDQQIPFMDQASQARILDKQGNFRLFRSMLPVGLRDIAFNGFNSSFFSQLNAEIGAMWIGDYLKGGIRLPDEAQQNRDIDERLAWMQARTDGKHCKGTNIIPFSIHHMDELLRDMGLQLSAPRRVAQWFEVLDPSDYAPRLEALLARYGVR